MNALLSLQGVSKRYRPEDAPAVADVSFDVAPGEVFALLGPSGCGKTTTLRLIAGFESADEGSIDFCGKRMTGHGVHVAPECRGIGFVFQDYALFPHLDVRCNVMFGLKRYRRAEREARADELLDRLRLDRFAGRKPHELSGGQQQRVAVARSMAPACKLILLDEPFNNLDNRLRRSARAEVRGLLAEHGTAAILVTHDREEALGFADRLGVMRLGRLEQVGTPKEIYYRPRTSYVAQFISRANLMTVAAEGRRARSALGLILLDRECRGERVVALRPEQLVLHPPENGHSRGTIITREFQGATMTYEVRLAGEVICVEAAGSQPTFSVGDGVDVRTCEPAVVVDDRSESSG